MNSRCTGQIWNCWCHDINTAQQNHHFDYLFVDEADFESYKPDSFAGLVTMFRKYK